MIERKYKPKDCVKVLQDGVYVDAIIAEGDDMYVGTEPVYNILIKGEPCAGLYRERDLIFAYRVVPRDEVWLITFDNEMYGFAEAFAEKHDICPDYLLMHHVDLYHRVSADAISTEDWKEICCESVRWWLKNVKSAGPMSDDDIDDITKVGVEEILAARGQK